MIESHRILLCGVRTSNMHCILFRNSERMIKYFGTISNFQWHWTVWSNCSRVPAHRHVIAAASEFFKRMFTFEMKETDKREISLHDISGSLLKQLVEFYYSGTVNLSIANAEHILVHANRYCLTRLEETCKKYIMNNLNMENCCSVLAAADAHMIADLKKTASDFICQRFMDFVRTDAFRVLQTETLISILKNDDIVVVSEEDTASWSEVDSVRRSEQNDPFQTVDGNIADVTNQYSGEISLSMHSGNGRWRNEDIHAMFIIIFSSFFMATFWVNAKNLAKEMCSSKRASVELYNRPIRNAIASILDDRYLW